MFHPCIRFTMKDGATITQGSDEHGRTETLEQATALIATYHADLAGGYLESEGVASIGTCWVEDDNGKTVWEG